MPLEKSKAARALRPASLACGGLPVQPAGDHQVQHQPEIAFDADGDALADAAHGADGSAFDAAERRIDGAQQEDRAEAHPFERLAEDARSSRAVM